MSPERTPRGPCFPCFWVSTGTCGPPLRHGLRSKAPNLGTPSFLQAASAAGRGPAVPGRLDKDEKFSSKLEEQGERFSQQLEAQEETFSKKLEGQEQRFSQQLAAHAAKIARILENDVTRRLNLLEEGQQSVLEKLVPRARVDEPEDEVKFLKSMVRRMDEELQALKKAN